jgi:hypothetical protein
VDPDRVAIDLYRRSEAGLWVLHPSRLGDPVELASVGVTIPVETIYEDASP